MTISQIREVIPDHLQHYLPTDTVIKALLKEWQSMNLTDEEIISMIEHGCIIKLNEKIS